MSDTTPIQDPPGTDGVLRALEVNDKTILKALAQMHKLHQEAQGRMAESHAALQAGLHDLRGEIAGLQREIRTLTVEIVGLKGGAGHAAPAVVIAGDDFSAQNPEVGLLEYLHDFLPDPVAIDVGANVGNFARRLLARGYAVYAFEPYGPSFAQLEKLGPGEKFHAFPYAIGREDGTMDLHIAADSSGSAGADTSLFHSLVPHPMVNDLRFGEKIPVPVRSIGSLWQSGEIPRAAGLLKIDAEGYDLQVMRGLGEAVFSVVMAEFWDPAHAFHSAAAGRVADLADEMNRRGCPWYIVIYHVDEAGTISYYCNRAETVPKSWGNVIFFRDRELFARALAWCDRVLQPTFHR